MQGDQALVIGGGGVAGIAWITGLLAGLAVAGRGVTGAYVIIGTSAGAAVAAQVGSDLPLDQLFARRTRSAPTRSTPLPGSRPPRRASLRAAAAWSTPARPG
jgi:NTE family protein